MNNVGSRIKAEVDNEFRLVKVAIDAGYFAPSEFPGGKTVTKIKIVYVKFFVLVHLNAQWLTCSLVDLPTVRLTVRPVFQWLIPRT